MRKYLPRPIMSDSNRFEIQFQTWLNDSHYWIDHSETVSSCKWCNMIMPNELKRSVLYKNNPEILKIKTNEFL